MLIPLFEQFRIPQQMHEARLVDIDVLHFVMRSFFISFRTCFQIKKMPFHG